MASDPAKFPPEYLSFLLRLWRVNGGGQPVWRASVQRPGEAIPAGFAGLEELFAFLRAATGTDLRETMELEAPM